MTKLKIVVGNVFKAIGIVALWIAGNGIWILCFLASPLFGLLLGWIPGFLILCVIGEIEDHAARKAEARRRDELAWRSRQS